MSQEPRESRYSSNQQGDESLYPKLSPNIIDSLISSNSSTAMSPNEQSKIEKRFQRLVYLNYILLFALTFILIFMAYYFRDFTRQYRTCNENYEDLKNKYFSFIELHNRKEWEFNKRIDQFVSVLNNIKSSLVMLKYPEKKGING